MRRRLFALALAGSIAGVPISYAQDATDSKKAASEVEAIKLPVPEMLKKIETDVPVLMGEMRKVNPNNADARMQVLEKVNALFDGAMASIAADAKNEKAVDLLMASLRVATSAQSRNKAAKVVEENLLTHPKVIALIVPMSTANPSLVDKILEKNPSKEVKGVAAYAKGQIAYNKYLQSDKKDDADEALKHFNEVPADLAKIKGANGLPLDVSKSVADMKFFIENIGIGKKMPDLTSVGLDGKPVKLSDHKGKVVVLDIWATWCPPCRAMIPHERELVERLKEKPFVLISISGDDKVETLKDFLEKEKMPWVHWFDGQGGDVMKKLNIRAFPTIFVLDAKGVVRYKGVRGEKMDAAVDTLLKEVDSN
jgi:thiol-disulfide isomerase/thioredoxin